MRCSKCGNEIPDGSVFCIRCGAKLEPGTAADAKADAKTAKADEKAAKKALKEAKANAKNAKKEAKEAKRIAKGRSVKKHTGLKVFLVFLILILLIAGGAVASWFYVIPQSTKDFLFLNREINKGNYEAVPAYFTFSDKSISSDSSHFAEYASENIVSSLDIKDVPNIWNGIYELYDNSGAPIILTYDDKSGKFDGDQFTYSFNIMEPILIKPESAPSKEDDRYAKKHIAGFKTDSFNYECDVTLGNDATSQSNMLKVKLSLKDGAIDKIESCTIDNDAYNAADFVEVKKNTLYVKALVVDEDYAKDICTTFADFTDKLTKSACKGISYEEYITQFEGRVIPELYKDDYEFYYGDREFYNSYEYDISLSFDHLNELPLYHVEDTSLIISAFFKGRIKSILDEEIIDQDSYILVRPYESRDCFIMNSAVEKDMQVLGEKLDEGLSYEDAMTAVFHEIYSETAEEAPSDEQTDDVSETTAKLTTEEKEAYLDALTEYSDKEDHPYDPRFTFADIGQDYPLMICTDGDYHPCTSYVYQYDPKKKRVVELGAFGEFGELSIDCREGMIMTYCGGMGYYMLDYYLVDNAKADHEVELTIYEVEGKKTEYTSKGETITEKQFNEIVSEYEEAYPESDMTLFMYSEAYDINDENIKEILF